MKKRIFWGMYLLVLAGVIVSLLVSSVLMYNEMSQAMEQSLRRQATLVAHMVDENGADSLHTLEPRGEEERITVITREGTVLYDTREDPEKLENHLERPEIRTALEKGEGEAKRYSDTLKQTIFYYALETEDGEIVRVSSAVKNRLVAMADSIFWLVILLVAMIFVVRFFAGRLTNRFLEPINGLDLDNPTNITNYPELDPIVQRLNSQNIKIQRQIEEIEQRQRQTTFFLENMQEGILLLDKALNITAVNSSAIELLNARPLYYTGKHFYQLSRHPKLQDSLRAAQQGEYRETILTIEGRTTSMHCSPIWEQGKVEGVVCFLLDVTEKEQTDKLRREFSATVSHELRTPLTSISGYAEIMKNGLVKSEDMEEFADKIYQEAGNLILMVDDIMRLSQLDEDPDTMVHETVDLYEIAKQVVQRLQPLAEEKNLTLSVFGSPAPMQGIPGLLTEILYNLVDNSIKYSDEGTIEVTVKPQDMQVLLLVKDQGQGIAPEHQSRVFERFYREDKSHSKATGGSGLGLAIVKHGVKHHGGKITLDSIPEKGTTVQILLPRRPE